VSRATSCLGVSIREYRSFQAGEPWPDFETWDRICELYGWPQTFVQTSKQPGNCRIGR
jgi:hypothetical protein